MFLQPHDTILFQGDSITNAFRKPDEVNNAHQLGAGYAFLIAAELNAVFVPLQCERDAAVQHAPAACWIYDGVHPTAPGQWLIAQAWLRATDCQNHDPHAR